MLKLLKKILGTEDSAPEKPWMDCSIQLNAEFSEQYLLPSRVYVPDRSLDGSYSVDFVGNDNVEYGVWVKMQNIGKAPENAIFDKPFIFSGENLSEPIETLSWEEAERFFSQIDCSHPDIFEIKALISKQGIVPRA